MSDRIAVTGGQTRAEGALDIELAPSFAAGDRRCNHAASRPIRIGTRGNASGEEERYDIVSAFLICGQETELAQKRKVAEAVVSLRIVVPEIRRNVEHQFYALAGNQLQPLAVSEIDQIVSGSRLLDEEIGPEFLFQSGRDSYQRRHPVRLIALGFVRAAKPGVLRMGGASEDQKHD